MLRRLLTCLALLTGLAAAGAPAQAHPGEAGIARIEAGLCQIASDKVVAAAFGDAKAGANIFVRAPIERTTAPRFGRLAPDVRIGIDRSHE